MNAWIHHPSPQDLFLELSWIPMVQGGDTNTSLLSEVREFVPSISRQEFIPTACLTPAQLSLFSQTSFLFYILSSSRDTGVSWLKVLSWSSFSELPTAEGQVFTCPWQPLSVHCFHADHSLQPPPSLSLLPFLGSPEHLSEQLWICPCGSDSCQWISLLGGKRFICGDSFKDFPGQYLVFNSLTLCKYNKVCQHLYAAWRCYFKLRGWNPLIFVPTWDQFQAFRKIGND